jgi:hypothetical protein
MSVVKTAIVAKAVSDYSKDKPMKSNPTSIKESIAAKPLQWLIVAGAGFYFINKFVSKAVEDQSQKKAETESGLNPWSPSSFFSAFWKKYPNAKFSAYNSAASYKLAKEIYDAMNVTFDEDEDVVVTVFNTIPSQYRVAQVVQQFQNYFKKDVLKVLKDGIKTVDIKGGIPDADYDRIIQMVKRKPLY